MARLHRTVSVLVLVIAASLAAPTRADELRGVALVIGQADYETLHDLGNTLNDARAMDEMLSDLGFEVSRVLDRGGDRLKRAIADFVEDAAGADVALVYYAGHAVEAAGQNYLVPVDADLSAPRVAGESLVPVGELLDELARIVPVTIMLLDACRTEAFPDGAAVLLPGRDTPVAIGGTGLTEIRGPTPVLANIAPESLGMVIGFAAAPGQAALDGAPGGNSPYASALLKHLGAGGYGFGELMTMVTEEVYLRTGAKQVPWTNSSLRRVLSFGAPIEAGDGDEAMIREGRRKLLLSIAGMPADMKRQVETAAASAAVPMDTLYGLLDALGAEAPSDPAALNQLLQTQTETIRKVMAEREALTSTDPEITRLADLAQRALDEGALAVSVSFWEAAKARYGEISASLDSAEALLRERRLEGGALYARAAGAYRLAGDYAAAADNYELAFAEVERWDEAAALQYKWGAADALYDLGVEGGVNAALDRSILAYRDALRLAPEGSDQWARLQYDLGGTLSQLSTRNASDETLAAAITAFEASIAAQDRASAPVGWARAKAGLAAALSIASDRDLEGRDLPQAVAAYRDALEILTPETTPYEWGVAQNNLGLALRALGEREAGSDNLKAAIEVFRRALIVASRETAPYDWAVAQGNLGASLLSLGVRERSTAYLGEATQVIEAALEVATRERMPMQWALTQANLATALMQLGDSEEGIARYEQAAAAYKAVLEEYTPERSLTDWALAKTNLSTVQLRLWQRRAGDHYAQDAIGNLRDVIAGAERARAPLQWALAQNNLGAVLVEWGGVGPDTAPFTEALTALNAALEERTRERSPLDWAMTQGNIGDALAGIGLREAGTARLVEAAEHYRAALEVETPERDPLRWAELHKKAGDTLLEAGLREETDIAHFRGALDAYNAALTVYTQERYPLDWAGTVNGAGWALANAGYRMGDLPTLQQGRDAIQAAWDEVRASGQTQHDDYFSERLGLIDEVIASATLVAPQ